VDKIAKVNFKIRDQKPEVSYSMIKVSIGKKIKYGRTKAFTIRGQKAKSSI